jgi:hypothetical protein
MSVQEEKDLREISSQNCELHVRAEEMKIAFLELVAELGEPHLLPEWFVKCKSARIMILGAYLDALAKRIGNYADELDKAREDLDNAEILMRDIQTMGEMSNPCSKQVADGFNITLDRFNTAVDNVESLLKFIITLEGICVKNLIVPDITRNLSNKREHMEDLHRELPVLALQLIGDIANQDYAQSSIAILDLIDLAQGECLELAGRICELS